MIPGPIQLAGNRLTELIAEDVALRERIQVEVRHGRLLLRPSSELVGAVVELRPPSNPPTDVPTYLVLREGGSEIAALGYVPAGARLVPWDLETRASGLLVSYPQHLTGGHRAGSDHIIPVAGARRADGQLELWIESSAQQDVTATVVAERALGDVADIEVVNAGRRVRLLVALTPHGTDRMLGFAHLPIDPTEPLEQTIVRVESEIPGVPREVLVASREAAASIDAERRFDAALARVDVE